MFPNSDTSDIEMEAAAAILQIGNIPRSSPDLPPLTRPSDSNAVSPTETHWVALPQQPTPTPLPQTLNNHLGSSSQIPMPRPVSCTTCRHYRKKCDSLTPSCSRCIQRGVACDYGASSFFVAGSTMDSEHLSTAVPTSRTPVKAISCKVCYTKKLKCDKVKPACSGCIKKGTDCEYVVTAQNDHLMAVGVDHKRLRVEVESSSAVPPKQSYHASLLLDEADLMNEQETSTDFQQNLKRKRSLDSDTLVTADSCLADIVISRLPQLPDGTSQLLTAAKLWIKDPITSEKVYCCPAAHCKKEYKTSNGLRYHLAQHTDSKNEFPTGYYFDRDAPDAEKEQHNYVCPIQGCSNDYTSAGGLKYHLLHGHSLDEDELEQDESSETDEEQVVTSDSDGTGLDQLVQIAKFKSLKKARMASKVAAAMANGKSLADIVFDRLPKLKPGVQRKLSCAKLWVLDPESGKQLFFCPISTCQRMYPTGNGMRYHLSNGHKDPTEFPVGWYWGKKGRSEVAEEKNIELPFHCNVGKCKARFSKSAGLNCHITRMHGRDTSEEHEEDLESS